MTPSVAPPGGKPVSPPLQERQVPAEESRSGEDHESPLEHGQEKPYDSKHYKGITACQPQQLLYPAHGNVYMIFLPRLQQEMSFLHHRERRGSRFYQSLFLYLYFFPTNPFLSFALCKTKAFLRALSVFSVPSVVESPRWH